MLIPLTQGKSAVVDDADFDWLSQWNWCAYEKGKTFYAVRGGLQAMHIAIFGRSGVDHVDGNGLNNQRSNLRAANKSQNGMNRGKNKNNHSGFKGVHWWSTRSIWASKIMVSRRTYHVGYFDDPKDAAMAYDIAAIKLHGEFARTNKMLGLLP